MAKVKVDLEELAELRKTIEREQRIADRAAGALDELWKEIKREFGVTDVKALKVLLKKAEAEATRLEGEYADVLEELREKMTAHESGRPTFSIGSSGSRLRSCSSAGEGREPIPSPG